MGAQSRATPSSSSCITARGRRAAHCARDFAEHRALGPAGERVAELRAEGVERGAHRALRAVRGEVHDVVGHAAEGVERERGAALLGRQEMAREPEGAGVGAHDSAAVPGVVLDHARSEVERRQERGAGIHPDNAPSPRPCSREGRPAGCPFPNVGGWQA